MKNLLIVDDDKTNLTFARNALSDIYKITAVISGEQALKFLSSNIPDLILLDINMPVMDGFEVMKNIRKDERLQYVPVIFLTADSEASTECRCLEEGAVDFIVKPFTPLVMRSRISRVLELEELRKGLRAKLDQKIREVSDIKEKSSHDPLTGLLTRNYISESVTELLAKESSGALFMTDMDNFKLINDVYGHSAGDEVLRMFAETLSFHASEGDITGRLGGDEFVMFIKGTKTKEELGKIAKSIIDEVTVRVAEAGYDTGTSVSVGISLYPADGEDFDSLCHAADKALYLVKQNGKGSFHFHKDQRDGEDRRRGKLFDIKYLTDYLARSDENNGSYILSIESFNHVYNFIRRMVERNDSEVQTILFTFTGENDSDGDLDDVLEVFEKVVFTSLRRVDVSTRYSGRQMLVVLMNVNTENCVHIAERILDAFRDIYNGPDVGVRYAIERLERKSGTQIPG